MPSSHTLPTNYLDDLGRLGNFSLSHLLAQLPKPAVPKMCWNSKHFQATQNAEVLQRQMSLLQDKLQNLGTQNLGQMFATVRKVRRTSWCGWRFRNRVNSPVEVEVGRLCRYLQGFIHHRWLFGIYSIKSMVKGYSPETKSLAPKVGLTKRKLIFQPSIFRCYVCFRGGITCTGFCTSQVLSRISEASKEFGWYQFETHLFSEPTAEWKNTNARY